MNSSAGPRTGGSPRGKTAIGIFLLFGAVMASLAGATLLWRGTALDRMWTLNPRAYKELAPLGKLVGIPFLMLGVLLAVAAWVGSNAVFEGGGWLWLSSQSSSWET
jgi:hypothetical protein